MEMKSNCFGLAYFQLGKSFYLSLDFLEAFLGNFWEVGKWSLTDSLGEGCNETAIVTDLEFFPKLKLPETGMP